METYATVLTYAIPGFIGLIIIESIAARIMGLKINTGMDTISSLSSGMTNTMKSLLGLSVVILSYDWMVQNWALFEIKSTVWIYILAFVGLDFAGYWSHRFNHKINVFWNRHVIHHSSEEFNLSCALRQTISSFVGIYFFLYVPMAIIGIPAEVVALLAPLHLFAQFWYHTRIINRMGFLEYILVTPSHHRVHHAINPEYIDKNLSEIFIVWDKIFGTFQKELDDVPPIYGTLKPARTWNPVIINFMHIWMLIKDAWRTQSIWDKVRIWFMPTGWRPADVHQNYPVHTTEDVYSRAKYDTNPSPTLMAWSWFQLIFNNLLLYYALANFGEFAYTDVVLYLIFLFLSVFAYTTLMDGHRLAIAMELVKMSLGLFLVYKLGGWYQLDEFFPGATLGMIGYLGLSFLLTLYFSNTESQKKSGRQIAVPE